MTLAREALGKPLLGEADGVVRLGRLGHGRAQDLVQAGAELVREAHAGSKTTSVKVTGAVVAFRYACWRAASNQAL
jgi:hypothetical protein